MRSVSVGTKRSGLFGFPVSVVVVLVSLVGLLASLVAGAVFASPASAIPMESAGAPANDEGGVVVPGNDPDNPNVPSAAVVAEKVDVGELVTVNVAVQLPDGSVRIDTRMAVGPEDALGQIQDAADEPGVVAADVAVPVSTFDDDPYRKVVPVGPYFYAGQFGLDALCTDAVAASDWLTLFPAEYRCGGVSTHDFATGEGRVVAVLDTAVQTSHEDLVGNLLGAVSCLSAPCQPASYTADQAHYHGTHVAGIVAAVSDNGIGVAGQAKGAKVLPVTVFDNSGRGSTTAVARGVSYAVEAGVDVINMSLGGAGLDTAFEAAVNAALAQGVTVVAAAGNDGEDSPTNYPAAFDGVIGVGAMNFEMTDVAGFSSRGDWVDVMAPGSSVLSTVPQNSVCIEDAASSQTLTGYCYLNGTSMATPFVAGLAAQVLERNPRLSPGQVDEHLRSTARDLGDPGRDDVFGFGVVDGLRVVRDVPFTFPRPTGLSFAAGDGSVTVAFVPPAETTLQKLLRYEYSIDGGPWVTAGNGRTESPVTIRTAFAGEVPLQNGVEYELRLRAVSSGGAGEASEVLRVRPAAVTPSDFVAIDPVRVYDSRWVASGKTAGLELGALPAVGVQPSGRVVPVRDGRSSDGGVVAAGVVPAGATAVTYNITATGQTSSGFLSVTPGDVVSAPNSSVLNWVAARQTRANGFVSAVDSSGRLRVFAGGSGVTHFVVDVTGYYVPPQVQQGSVFVPFDAPVRAYDSRWRDVEGVATGVMSGAQSRVVSVADSRASVSGEVIAGDVVPVGASGVAYNVTITGNSGSGFLALAPGDQGERPAVSTVNWSSPVTIANATSGKISTDREMKVFSVAGGAGGSTHFIVDVVGYFVPADAVPADVDGARFVPLSPLRSYDSRAAAGNGGALFGGGPAGGMGAARVTSAALDAGVPVGASAVAFNLTVTGNAGTGFLEVTPGNSGSSGTSTANWVTPTTVANGSIVGVDAEREVASHVGGRFSTQYLIDIAGYFAPIPE